MSAHPPPVPPANRSPKGSGGGPKPGSFEVKKEESLENLNEQDHQGNIHQNTTNRGYKQDR